MNKNQNNYYLPRFFALLTDVLLSYFFIIGFSTLVDDFLPKISDYILFVSSIVIYVLILSIKIYISGQSFGMSLFKIKFAPYDDEKINFLSIFMAEFLLFFIVVAIYSFAFSYGRHYFISYNFYIIAKYSVYTSFIITFITLFIYGKLPLDLIRSVKILRQNGSNILEAIIIIPVFLVITLYNIWAIERGYLIEYIAPDYTKLEINFNSEANHYKQIYYKEFKYISNAWLEYP